MTSNDPENPPSWGQHDFSLFLVEVSGQDTSNELSRNKFGTLGVSKVHRHSKNYVIELVTVLHKKIKNSVDGFGETAGVRLVVADADDERACGFLHGERRDR